MSGQGAHLKLLCDDAKHSLDGSEAAHKLLLGSINLGGITINIIVIIVIVIINTTVVTTVLLYTSSIFNIAVNNHKTLQPTWQARLFRRKIPARCK